MSSQRGVATMLEPQEALREGSQTLAPLGVLTSLFARLHAENILYCHWKSNEHVHATMLGAQLTLDQTDCRNYV